jgi:hypothetical protein
MNNLIPERMFLGKSKLVPKLNAILNCIPAGVYFGGWKLSVRT